MFLLYYCEGVIRIEYNVGRKWGVCPCM